MRCLFFWTPEEEDFMRKAKPAPSERCKNADSYDAAWAEFCARFRPISFDAFRRKVGKLRYNDKRKKLSLAEKRSPAYLQAATDREALKREKGIATFNAKVRMAAFEHARMRLQKFREDAAKARAERLKENRTDSFSWG